MKTKAEKKASAKLVRAKHKARIKAKRPAHKKLLLHPATVFLLLCVGVLLLGQSLIAKADVSDSVSYSVHGRVPAAPLTEPAVIIHPKDGDQVEGSPITLSGSCPTESYIKLYRNDIFAGTTFCTNDGTFTLQAGLSEGNNKLQAHVFNITDDEGPLSPSINIVYKLPLPPTTTGLPAKPPPSPFLISSNYSFSGFRTGTDVSWKLSIISGTGPYALNLNWGDNSESNYVLKAPGDIVVDHSYKKAGVYPTKVRAVDAIGGSGFLQVVAYVTDGNTGITGFFTPGSTSSAPQPPSESSGLYHWRWVAASAYGVVSLMTLSFWLGEQTQYLHVLHASRRGSLRQR